MKDQKKKKLHSVTEGLPNAIRYLKKAINQEM